MGTTRRYLLMMIWAGPVCILLAGIGWVAFCQFLPPPSPDMTPAEVQDLWSEDTNLKRIGLTLAFWGGPLYIPFILAISALLRRDPRQRELSIAQAGVGIFATVFVTLNFLVLLVVAFRPERDGEVMQVMHDLGFMMTVMPAAPFTVEYLLIGAAILMSNTDTCAFPRWVGYFSIWTAILFLPACAVPFFKDGLLAWNGLLGFWVPGIVFMVWMVAMTWVMHRAVTADDAPEGADEPVVVPVPEPVPSAV